MLARERFPTLVSPIDDTLLRRDVAKFWRHIARTNPEGLLHCFQHMSLLGPLSEFNDESLMAMKHAIRMGIDTIPCSPFETLYTLQVILESPAFSMLLLSASSLAVGQVFHPSPLVLGKHYSINKRSQSFMMKHGPVAESIAEGMRAAGASVLADIYTQAYVDVGRFVRNAIAHASVTIALDPKRMAQMCMYGRFTFAGEGWPGTEWAFAQYLAKSTAVGTELAIEWLGFDDRELRSYISNLALLRHLVVKRWSRLRRRLCHKLQSAYCGQEITIGSTTVCPKGFGRGVLLKSAIAPGRFDLLP